jgi:hypothetical protein
MQAYALEDYTNDHTYEKELEAQEKFRIITRIGHCLPSQPSL